MAPVYSKVDTCKIKKFRLIDKGLKSQYYTRQSQLLHKLITWLVYKVRFKTLLSKVTFTVTTILLEKVK